MEVIGRAFLNSLITLQSKRLSYGNFMFIENVHQLYYPESGDTSLGTPTNDDARNLLFNKGVTYDKDGRKDEALKCYLKCLVGLKENTRFALLPQCLRNVSMQVIYAFV